MTMTSDTIEVQPIDKIETKEQSNKALPVSADDRGRLIGRTMEEQIRVANMILAGGTLPKAFDTVAKVMTGMQYAIELGLNPITALRQMYFVHGAISIFGDQPLALVEAKGLIAEHQEYLIDKDYNKICVENKNLHVQPWAAVCITKRKGREESLETYFTIDQAKEAGLYKNTWLKYPGDMLTYRARSRNLKSNFPDALGGIAISEFDMNEMPTARDVSENLPKDESAKNVNAMFK